MPSNHSRSPPVALRLFVTNFGRGAIGRIDIIDISSHRVLGEVIVGVRPLAATVSALGDLLFVVCGGSNELYIIETASRRVIKQLPVGLGPDALGPFT